MPAPADPVKDVNAIGAIDETTPLLDAGATATRRSGAPTSICTKQDDDADGETSEEPCEDGDEKPMPVNQILLLCYASLAEPITYFAIFPFVNEMIYRNSNLPEADVGYFSGLIESLFSLVQMLLMLFYGRAADRLGRKPVLVFSLTGMGTATALFGMSRTLAQMIITRCFAGVFAGCAVTTRTMMSENCNAKTQGRAFSWYMFCRNLGIFLGPLIGGALADPAREYPSAFGNVQFFKDYPYALATFGAGGFCLTTTLTSLFFLKETLPASAGDPSLSAKPMSTWEVLKSPGVAMVLYIFGHTMLLALAYTAVSPVFLFTSIRNGGFALNDAQIAAFLCVSGGSQALWMLLAFPPLQRRFSTGLVLRGCAIVWPVMMALFPVANELLRHGWMTTFWIVLPVTIVGGSGVSMAFACVQLCINDISPSSTVLATVNALALTVNSGVRAFAPIAFTSLFATGVKLGWADGHLVWFVLVAIAFGLNLAIYFLPAKAEGNHPSKGDDRRQEEEDGAPK